jgi:hypothetical protein
MSETFLEADVERVRAREVDLIVDTVDCAGIVGDGVEVASGCAGCGGYIFCGGCIGCAVETVRDDCLCR